MSTRRPRNWDNMRWQELCESMSTSPEILQGAILQNDGHILASTPGFNIDLDNMKVKDLFVRSRNFETTFTVAGEEYYLRRASAASVHGARIGDGGRCILVKNPYVIVIGIYENPPTANHDAQGRVGMFAINLMTEIERTPDPPGDPKSEKENGEDDPPGDPKSDENIKEVNSGTNCTVM